MERPKNVEIGSMSAEFSGGSVCASKLAIDLNQHTPCFIVALSEAALPRVSFPSRP